MNPFTLAVRQAIEQQNWYAALAVSLIMPDICGGIDQPTERSSKKRYVNWFNRFLLETNTMRLFGETYVFLDAEDCYALRCSFLHSGEDAIEGQAARKSLERFQFIAPEAGRKVHRSRDQRNGTLALQIDLFCKEMCDAVDEWLTAVVAQDSSKQGQLTTLLRVYTVDEWWKLFRDSTMRGQSQPPVV